MTSKEVRADFDKAFSLVKRGEDLSVILDYGFFDEDLVSLAKLHKEGKHREKIEDLLTDCNFHKECELMVSGDYSMWIKEEM